LFGLTPKSVFSLSLAQAVSAHRRPRNTITVAVDATETKGGGLLVLPHIQKVFFYSIDWSNILKFDGMGSDKFEMMNAYIALRLFESYISFYRRESDQDAVVLKIDNNFCEHPLTVYSGTKNAHWRKVFLTVQSKLESHPISGEWRYITNGIQQDNFLRMADKLSRNDCSSSAKLPDIQVLQNVDSQFLKYSHYNISLGHEPFLKEIAKMLPPKE